MEIKNYKLKIKKESAGVMGVSRGTFVSLLVLLLNSTFLIYNLHAGGISTNKTFMLNTNNVLLSNETNFFDTNIVHLTNALAAAGFSAGGGGGGVASVDGLSGAVTGVMTNHGNGYTVSNLNVSSPGAAGTALALTGDSATNHQMIFGSGPTGANWHVDNSGNFSTTGNISAAGTIGVIGTTSLENGHLTGDGNGNITAVSFTGSGAGLTSLPAAFAQKDIAPGAMIGVNNINTTNSATYWYLGAPSTSDLNMDSWAFCPQSGGSNYLQFYTGMPDNWDANTNNVKVKLSFLSTNLFYTVSNAYWGVQAAVVTNGAVTLDFTNAPFYSAVNMTNMNQIYQTAGIGPVPIAGLCLPNSVICWRVFRRSDGVNDTITNYVHLTRAAVQFKTTSSAMTQW